MARITWLGHATVLIETAGGARLLTDPVLRGRVAHLRRHATPVGAGQLADGVDGVLISHVHHDHLDRASLRRVARDGTAIALPRGAARLLRGVPFAPVHEVAVGTRVTVGGAEIEVVPAWHPTRRLPRSPLLDALGYLVDGIWFAGDTDLDARMAALRGRVDLALLPIWGWGPSLGTGHLDPRSAAAAVALVQPAAVVPIHWGTLLPLGTRRRHRVVLTAPAEAFARHVAELAPGVRVVTLAPGGSLELPAPAGSSA